MLYSLELVAFSATTLKSLIKAQVFCKILSIMVNNF